VLFVGYQAYGTLGRRLVDGAKYIRIAGEDVIVKAQIHTLNGFSAHADRDDLLRWASSFPAKARFIVSHGEPKSSTSLAMGLKDKGYRSIVPAVGDEIDLLSPAEETVGMPVVSHGILDHMKLGAQDVSQTLAAIAAHAENLQRLPVGTADYSAVMPLLISAKTLLETAEKLSAKEKKSA